MCIRDSGVTLMLETVMSTVSATESTVPSLTTNSNVSVTGVFDASVGTVNVGDVADALDSVTFVPAVCVHAKVNASPSGSEDPDPSRLTDTASFTD